MFWTYYELLDMSRGEYFISKKGPHTVALVPPVEIITQPASVLFTTLHWTWFLSGTHRCQRETKGLKEKRAGVCIIIMYRSYSLSLYSSSVKTTEWWEQLLCFPLLRDLWQFPPRVKQEWIKLSYSNCSWAMGVHSYPLVYRMTKKYERP